MPIDQIDVTIVRYSDRRNLMMRYIDPVTGRQKARSTGTTKRREAERIAAKWEAELREGRYQETKNISWPEFRERYEDEKLAAVSDHMAKATASALNHVERLIAPKHLAAMTTSAISRLQVKFRQEGMKDATICTHLRHLQVALNWAVSMGLLGKSPKIILPRRSKGTKLMRGRPLDDQEYKKMLGAVAEIRPQDTERWKDYLAGLWLSGLRLEESTILSWDEDSPFAVDLSGRRPKFRIYAEGEKGRRDRLLPITPDFAEILQSVPPSERHGPVFKLPSLISGEQLNSKSVGRIVARFGRKAGIVVNKAEGKYASAHDLRRSFGTRWASRVKPATLQLLMRHESIETTMKYYVAQDSDYVADELWASYEQGENGADTAGD